MKDCARMKQMRVKLVAVLSLLLVGQQMGPMVSTARADVAPMALEVVETPDEPDVDGAKADMPSEVTEEVRADQAADDDAEASQAPSDAPANQDVQVADAEAGDDKSGADGTMKEAPSGDVIHYLDEQGEDAFVSASECVNVNDCVRDGACHLTTGWYYVNSWCHQLGRGEVEGDVRLILCDGGSLEHFKGFHVGEGSKLSIYWQEGKSGKLVAGWNHEEGCAGIGGNADETSGEIYIYGGNIDAHGGEDGAGIGGGSHARCGRFEMYDGNVKATALSYSPFFMGPDMKYKLMELPGGGAGVGGGADSSGGIIRIHGGKLEATGGTFFGEKGGAGIGGGCSATAGNVVIDGGEVIAKGAKSAAGIGSSLCKDNGEIRISNCKVVAEGGELAAGIGGGESANGGHIYLTDADVTATGIGGAGIGGGNGAHGVKCVISGGCVTATSKVQKGTYAAYDCQGAAIGGGSWGHGGTITIERDARLHCFLENIDNPAQCLGRGRGDRNDAEIGLYDGASVLSGDTRVLAKDRAATLRSAIDVQVEPCPHEELSYMPGHEGHCANCPHCCTFPVDKIYPHEFGDDGCCKQCDYKKPHPYFVVATLPKDTSIGIMFWLEAPYFGAFDYGEDAVELSVSGKKARTVSYKVADGVQSGPQSRYGFFIPLNALEMAEKVTARFSYGDGESVEAETSIQELLRSYTIDTKRDAKATLAARALANYGYYVQRWLSQAKGWKLGGDYAPVDMSFPEFCDVASARAKTASRACLSEAYGANGEGANPSAGIDRVKAFARLDSHASLDVTVFSKLPNATNFRCECEGGSGTATGELREDGSYHVSYEGLCICDYDKPVKISFDADGVTYSAYVSMLSYLHSQLADESASSACQMAASAIYWAYTQAEGITRMGS